MHFLTYSGGSTFIQNHRKAKTSFYTKEIELGIELYQVWCDIWRRMSHFFVAANEMQWAVTLINKAFHLFNNFWHSQCSIVFQLIQIRKGAKLSLSVIQRCRTRSDSLTRHSPEAIRPADRPG
jgi:hypothetical protein